MGQSTFKASVTLGDQCVTFQQASIPRPSITYFLSRSSENNTLMASGVCFEVMFSLLCLLLLTVNGGWDLRHECSLYTSLSCDVT